MTKWVLLFSFIFGALGASAADAQAHMRSCSTVDLRAEMGPVRSQGDVGWCYANAAADLLSYRYREELKGKQVSAISVALEYNANLFFMDAWGEGGSSALAVLTYLKSTSRHNSLCLQTADDLVMSRGLKASLGEKLEAFKKLKILFDDYVKDRSRLQPFVEHWQMLRQSDSVLFTIPKERLFQILAKSDKDSYPMMIKAELCKNRSVTVDSDDVGVGGTSHWLPFVSQNDVIDTINRQLNKRNILGVSYYASILNSAETPTKRGSEHASVLIGRRWNKDAYRCEYLIRNSWGPRCNGYNNKNIQCESGNFWISETDLKRTLFSVTYLEARTDLKLLRSMLSALQ